MKEILPKDFRKVCSDENVLTCLELHMVISKKEITTLLNKEHLVIGYFLV